MVPREILFIVMEVPVSLSIMGLSKWNFQVFVAGLFLSLLQHLIATETVHLRSLVPSFSSAFTLFIFKIYFNCGLLITVASLIVEHRL